MRKAAQYRFDVGRTGRPAVTRSRSLRRWSRLRPLAALIASAVIAACGGGSLGSLHVDLEELPQGAEGLTLRLTGSGTSWQEGLSEVSFPDEPGIVVRSREFLSPTSATVMVDIPWTVAPGEKTIQVQTGAQVVSAKVQVKPSIKLKLQPSRIRRWENDQPASLKGNQTHFKLPGFGVSINPASGLEGTSVAWVVVDDTSADLTFNVGPEAIEGTYPDALIVHTDGADYFLELEVMPVRGRYIDLYPTAVRQGEAVTLQVVGHKTEFHLETFTLSIDPPDGIEIRSDFDVQSASVVEVKLWVHTGALVARRTVTVTDRWGVLRSSFHVREDATPPSVRLDPPSGELRWQGYVFAYGTNTTFTDGVTEVEVVCPTPTSPLSFTLYEVLGLEELVLKPHIPIDTPAETCDVWFHTGPEDASALFEVRALPEPSITVFPVEGLQGEPVPVTITGTNTHFSAAPGEETTLVLGGAAAGGTVVTGFTVIDENQATATLVIAEGAQTGPGALTLRMETPSWNEAPETSFSIAAGIPEATLTPSGVEQGASGVTVQATGRFTEWVAGQTTVTSPDCSLDVGPVNVTGLRSLSFTVTVPMFHAVKPCTIRIEDAQGTVDAALDVRPGYFEPPTIPYSFDGELTGGAERFLLNLREGDVLRVRVTRAVWESLDPEIALYRVGSSLDAPSAWNDDESPATVSSRIVYQAPETGMYFLQVRDHWGFEYGQFTVDLDWYAPEPTGAWEVTPLTAADGNDLPGGAIALGPVAAGECLRAAFQGDVGTPPADDETDWYVVPSPPAGIPLAIALLARDVSPFPSSTPEVVLRAYTDPSQAPIAEASFGMAGPDPVLYPAGLLAAPGAPLYVEVERAIGSEAHTAYWLNVRPWLVVNEVRLWEDPAPVTGDAFHGAFVELAGPSPTSPGDPGVPLAGCELRLLVDSTLHETFDLSLRSLTPLGYYVLAHDDSVPGTGEPHIDPLLAFPVGSTGAHAVQLFCGGTLLDAVQLTGAAGQGGEGTPLLPPALATTAMGRGFRIDTGDNRRDFLPQLEPSPWARNVSEVR